MKSISIRNELFFIETTCTWKQYGLKYNFAKQSLFQVRTHLNNQHQTLLPSLPFHDCRKRQRLEELDDSKTVRKLTDLVGRGKCSVSAAAELAQCVVEDHSIPHGAVKAFASLGSGGRNPQNCERDLHRWLRCLYGLQLQTYTLKMPLQVDSLKVREVPIRVLSPHEILHSLVTMDSNFAFASLMLGNLDDSARSFFWTHVKSLSPWSTHPIFQDPTISLSRLIGITIHADGAVMKRDDECFVWSISSCFGNEGMIKDPLLMKFPIAVIPERFMLDKNVTCFQKS